MIYADPYRAEDADLKILIADSSLLVGAVRSLQHFTPSLPAMADRFLELDDVSAQTLHHNWSEGATGVFTPQDTLVVLNKTDLLDSSEGREPFGMEREFLQTMCEGADVCAMSCKTGEGVERFMGHFEKMLRIM